MEEEHKRKMCKNAYFQKKETTDKYADGFMVHWLLTITNFFWLQSV